MLAHFGALAGARAALAQQAEAGQEQLAQGWAQLRRYREEAGSELLWTKDELTRLRARLEATRRDVLQGVRGDTHTWGSPFRERGSSVDPKSAAEGRCPTRWWWGEAGLGVPMCPEKASSGTLHGGIHSQDS